MNASTLSTFFIGTTAPVDNALLKGIDLSGSLEEDNLSTWNENN